MDGPRFDDLAREVASANKTRRNAIRTLFAGAAASVAALTGSAARPADAKATDVKAPATR